MTHPALQLDSHLRLHRGTMLLAFSGWMDGGEVSTGTVQLLMGHLKARRIGGIDPEGFYLYNVPGSMEVAALFRPHVRYDEGLIAEFALPSNDLYADVRHEVAFLVGKEPHLRWRTFADCVLEACDALHITRVVFVGSFGGSVPHSREPRLYVSVSGPHLKPLVQRYGARFTEYEGPASFSTYLMSRCGERSIDMISLAAEIPGYIQGTNPRSIEAVTRRLVPILGLSIDFSQLRVASDEWETRVNEMVAKDADLAKQIRELEENYDKEWSESA